MLTLLLETSTERALVAIAEGQNVLVSSTFETQFNQAQWVLPAIQQLFTDLSLTPQRVQRIGVGIGPGSYTGIRVAVTVAKVIAFSNQVPLVGIPSLTTFIPSVPGPFAALIDARIGGAYVLIGQSSQPSLVPMASLGPMLEGIPRLVSPQVAPLKRRLQEASPHLTWEWEERGPDPAQMAKLTEQLYAQGQICLDGQLELLYLRKTQAEIERGDQA